MPYDDIVKTMLARQEFPEAFAAQHVDDDTRDTNGEPSPPEAPRKVLIVDDQEPNRRLLAAHMSRFGLESRFAENGLAALAQMEHEPPDLVLLDLIMPDMTGLEVLERTYEDRALREIPIIVISGNDDMDNVARCIRSGAVDYLVKPFDSTILEARVRSCLEKKALRDKETAYRKQIQEYSLHLEDKVREQVKLTLSSQMAIIFSLSKLAESRDTDTGEHLERMREYCRLLAIELSGLTGYKSAIDDHYIEDIYTASPLHDVGKVGIPDSILLKPGRLTAEEFDQMKVHTVIGAETLKSVNERFPGIAFLRMGIDIAMSHHEKWDGSGYPHGLAGEDIPLSARILAFGDVYDALTSRRCYKDAMPHEKAVAIIEEGKGTHFCPDIVDVFCRVKDEFKRIRKAFADADEDEASL